MIWHHLNIEKEFPEAPPNADSVAPRGGLFNGNGGLVADTGKAWREAWRKQADWIEANKDRVLARMREIEEGK